MRWGSQEDVLTEGREKSKEQKSIWSERMLKCGQN